MHLVFQKQFLIYTICAKVTRGKVTTYKEIASALGVKAYQAIGNALRNNPYSLVVLCHRIIKSNENMGGYKCEIKGREIKNILKCARNRTF